MSAMCHLTHFDNFAWLHGATHADLPALSAFAGGWPAEMSSSLDWRQMVSDRDAYILIATECRKATLTTPAPNEFLSMTNHSPPNGWSGTCLGVTCRCFILHFQRLDQGTSAQWYLVTGFDGCLFRLVDVARQTIDETVAAAVTAPEMRMALAGPESPIGLTIAVVI